VEGQLDHGPVGSHDAIVTNRKHQDFARSLSEQGTVLLKNDGGALPIDDSKVNSVAVIGAAAQTNPIYTGGGSATVVPSHTVTPLEGIRARAGSGIDVTYAPGTLGTAAPPVLDTNTLTPTSGTGPGLTAEYFTSPDLSGTPAITRVDPTVNVTTTPAGFPTVWSARWTGTFTPTVSGLQRISFSGNGIARVWINEQLIINSANQLTIAAVDLPAGQPASIRVEFIGKSPFPGFLPAQITIGWSPPDATMWQAAIDAAKAADLAVVFVNDIRTEGADLSTLKLAGDQDQLTEAVAAANPRTVVVLNTGGPTLTPWRSKVDAVLEAWYPGQENGDAIASLLFGDVNPSGKLPATFPASDDQGPLTSPERFPGVNDVVRYDEGIFVGYRWYDAMGQDPAFPFGHGLSYTTFDYSRLNAAALNRGAKSTRVKVLVKNTGERAGAEVVEVYIGHLPTPVETEARQLAGFARVYLKPGQQQYATTRIDRQAFSYWDTDAGRWVTPTGQVPVYVGSSSRDIRLTGQLTVR
jgi:beta-glucosidase